MNLDIPHTDPVVEGFRLLTKSQMDNDHAILNLCDIMVKQIVVLKHEVNELHNQLDILLAIYQKEVIKS